VNLLCNPEEEEDFWNDADTNDSEIMKNINELLDSGKLASLALKLPYSIDLYLESKFEDKFQLLSKEGAAGSETPAAIRL
jgi:hypothetical protein